MFKKFDIPAAEAVEKTYPRADGLFMVVVLFFTLTFGVPKALCEEWMGGQDAVFTITKVDGDNLFWVAEQKIGVWVLTDNIRRMNPGVNVQIKFSDLQPDMHVKVFGMPASPSASHFAFQAQRVVIVSKK